MTQNEDTNWNRLAAVLDSELGIATAHLRDGDDSPDRIAQRAEQYAQHRLSRQQAHLEAVLRQAVLCMNDSAEPEEKTAASVDAGWLSQWLEGARCAVHEAEQNIWAGLLAREIKAPGSTARRTLCRLQEMDHWEVEAFIEYLPFVFAFDSGWRFAFAEDEIRREIWAYGREIDIGQHLINIGLLSPEQNRLDTRSARGLRLRYANTIYEIESGEAATNADAPSGGFHYRRLTPQGQQLAEAIKPKRFNGYARNVVNTLKKELGVHLKAIEE